MGGCGFIWLAGWGQRQLLQKLRSLSALHLNFQTPSRHHQYRRCRRPRRRTASRAYTRPLDRPVPSPASSRHHGADLDHCDHIRCDSSNRPAGYVTAQRPRACPLADPSSARLPPRSAAHSLSLAYVVYFDQQRRRSPDFRRQLRRQERRQVRAEKEDAVAQSKAKAKDIHNAVDAALEEGFPTGVNEKEAYFMEHVQEGEVLGQDRTLICTRRPRPVPDEEAH